MDTPDENVIQVAFPSREAHPSEWPATDLNIPELQEPLQLIREALGTPESVSDEELIERICTFVTELSAVMQGIAYNIGLFVQSVKAIGEHLEASK